MHKCLSTEGIVLINRSFDLLTVKRIWSSTFVHVIYWYLMIRYIVFSQLFVLKQWAAVWLLDESGSVSGVATVDVWMCLCVISQNYLSMYRPGTVTISREMNASLQLPRGHIRIVYRELVKFRILRRTFERFSTKAINFPKK